MTNLGPVTEDQVIPIYDTEIAGGRIKSTQSPYGYINFSVPEVTLSPDALYEVAIQVERDPEYEINWNADCYSILPPGDTAAADGSYWYWLGGNQHGHTSDTMRFVVGPGMFDHGAALAAGETGLHVELYGVQVLGIVWREMPTDGPVGSSDWSAAPEIPLNTMSVETPDGDSNSPGDVVDPTLEFDAVWWKHACTESGYYQFDAFGSRPESDTLYGYHDGYSIYVHEDSPVANPLAVGFTSWDAENSEAEGWGLVHMDAGKTYYFKVLYSKLNNQWATQTPSMYRFRLSKSLYSRLPDQGSPYPWDAPEMAPGGISRYTPNYMLFGGTPWAWLSRVAWWKFTATQDGLIGVDVYKTRFRPDGVFTDANAWSLTPYVDLYIFTKGTNGSYDYVYEGSGWDEMEVEAGVTYYFALGKDDYDERPMDYVFRMSEYAQSARYEPDPRVLTYGVPGTWGNQTITNGNDNYMAPQYGYHGVLNLSRSFGGPQPGSDPAALDCMWGHAKIGDHGDYYWSPNNQVQWNGGPGTCPAINTAYRESMVNFSDDPVGADFRSYGGTFGEARIRIFGTVQALNLSDAWRRLTYTSGWTWQQYNDNARAAAGAPSDAWVQPDDNYNCELLGAEFAPDEQVATAGSNTGTVKWYGGLTRPDNNSYVNGGFVTTRWGPVISRVHSDYRSFGGGGGGVPELQADYAHLADYSGGLAGWVALDHVAIRAHERAENGNPNDNSSVSGGYTGYDIPGFVATAIHQVMLQSNHPFTPATDTTQVHVRYYQRAAFRITVRPSPATVTWPVVYDEQTPADAPPDPAWSWQKVKGWIVGMIGWGSGN